MGLYPRVNYYKLAKELDFVSWDNYPWLSPSLPYKSALAGDLMRGLKAKNYWIMEQTAGPLGWDEFSTTPLPGELRKICYQQLAHGCDALVWFRWRTCTAGREQYWHGLLGHDGVPGRRYREAAKFAKECRALQDKLIGTTLKPQVAIIYDYDSLWALEIQEGYPGASYREAISRYYDALLRLGVNVDLIPPSADLDKYSLVIAPHLHILPDLIADRIDQYVQKGGTLLTDCRTGVKDPTNLAYPRTLPGKLSTALGITIPEYESTSVGMRAPATREYAIHSEQFGRGFTATKYVDWVSPTTATTIASYDKQSHLIDFAAVTRNEHGSGSAWYVGTIAKEDSFYDTLIAQVAKDAGVRPILDPPKGVEVSLRQGNGQRLLFVINHANSATTIDSVPTGAIDLLSEELPNGSVTLEPFGVAIYSLPPSKVDDSTTR